MKSRILFCLLGILSTMVCCAQENTPDQKPDVIGLILEKGQSSIASFKTEEINLDQDKIYVNSEQLAITPEGIFVNTNAGWLKTSGVQSDANGLYITSVLADQWSVFWKCPKCDYSNTPFSRKCSNCGYVPPH